MLSPLSLSCNNKWKLCIFFSILFNSSFFTIWGLFHFIAVSVDQGEYSKGRPCKNNVLLVPLKLKTNIMKTATFYLNYCFQKLTRKTFDKSQISSIVHMYLHNSRELSMAFRKMYHKWGCLIYWPPLLPLGPGGASLTSTLRISSLFTSLFISTKLSHNMGPILPIGTSRT